MDLKGEREVSTLSPKAYSQAWLPKQKQSRSPLVFLWKSELDSRTAPVFLSASGKKCCRRWTGNWKRPRGAQQKNDYRPIKNGPEAYPICIAHNFHPADF